MELKHPDGNWDAFLFAEHILENYTKYNFIIGQCAFAEIMCCGFERKPLVNTGWPIYKVQSVLLSQQYSSSLPFVCNAIHINSFYHPYNSL